MEVKSLRAYYEPSASPPAKAVDGISFDLAAGEVLGIVGESGCGKSTLARLLLRMLPPCSGQIVFQGADVTRLHGARQLKPYWHQVQGIFQHPFASFNQFYSVGRVLTKTLDLNDECLLRNERRLRLETALTNVGPDPSEVLGKGSHQLSGGQLQRAMIARALLVSPELRIADESTSMLDTSVRVTILNLLSELRKSSE